MNTIKNTAFIAPGKYIQGRGVIRSLRSAMEPFGTEPYILFGGTAFRELSGIFNQMFGEIEKRSAVFSGVVCEENTSVYSEKARSGGYDSVIGVGGGRVIDAAKIVANACGLPLVIVPTSAATDAPTSALAVIYSSSGIHIREDFYDSSPNLVLADSEIIAKAPVRLLIAGMGDALATYFEARACKNSGSSSNIKGGYRMTLAAYAIARECYAALLRDGEKARRDCEKGLVTPEVENIIEVNTLLSGVGAESCGASGAHAFHDGMTVLPETAKYYHGEKVSFGVVCQLVLEKAGEEELNEVLRFMDKVGLPMTLKEIGVENADPQRLRAAAEAVAASPLILREPFEVDVAMLLSAILRADEIGRSFKGYGQK